MRSALEDLQPERSFVVYPGDERFRLADGVEAIGLAALCEELAAGPAGSALVRRAGAGSAGLAAIEWGSEELLALGLEQVDLLFGLDPRTASSISPGWQDGAVVCSS